ncbi:MAG: chromate transporter [Planctomycetes bacterium]|nr:chromate transporter [Planctomycetota bacterium]HPY74853.1 chromate transporter [Planctomycetota bacterium]HQB00879.1 chromate transporter [Planctomycetota bacterium]
MKSILWRLFMTFFKIGLFTFGGGYAMIGIIENECVEKNKWITDEEMSTILAIAESTPGPISVNCATYTGYRQAKLLGAFVATLGLVLPSVIIIYVIALYFHDILEISYIAKAFQGIKIGVGVLIIQAGINMYLKLEQNKTNFLYMIFSCIFLLTINIFSITFSTVYLILFTGTLHVIYKTTEEKTKLLIKHQHNCTENNIE